MIVSGLRTIFIRDDNSHYDEIALIAVDIFYGAREPTVLIVDPNPTIDNSFHNHSLRFASHTQKSNGRDQLLGPNNRDRTGVVRLVK